jgi:RNA polymerase sigma factor (sigma-70 family)
VSDTAPLLLLKLVLETDKHLLNRNSRKAPVNKKKKTASFLATCYALFSLGKGKFMSRKFKTSKKKRTNYIYYPAEGPRIVITPGEDGVSETDIELLHTMDDEEVDEQRRYDYRIKANLDGYLDGEGAEADDRNKYLSDYSNSPERVYLEKEREAEHLATLERLTKAMEHLTNNQRELFKKKYVDQRTNTDIANEEGVSEAAIRNRLKKMHTKLKKHLK